MTGRKLVSVKQIHRQLLNQLSLWIFKAFAEKYTKQKKLIGNSWKIIDCKKASKQWIKQVTITNPYLDNKKMIKSMSGINIHCDYLKSKSKPDLCSVKSPLWLTLKCVFRVWSYCHRRQQQYTQWCENATTPPREFCPGNIYQPAKSPSGSRMREKLRQQVLFITWPHEHWSAVTHHSITLHGCTV